MRGNDCRILAVATLLVLGACTESSTLPQEDALTEFEAAQLASFLIDRSFTASGVELNGQSVVDPGVSQLQASPPVSLARVNFDEMHNLIGDCPLGGSLEVEQTIDGFVDNETPEYEINAVQTLIFDRCASQGESGDFSFTLDSSPDVSASLSMARDAAGVVTGSGAVAGGVDWSSEDRFGRCEIDIEFSLNAATDSARFEAFGSICGVEFRQNVSVSS